MPPVTLQNRDRIRTTSFYAAFALVTYLLYIVTKPFIVPLCAAAILVVFFYPAHARLERRYGAGPAALPEHDPGHGDADRAGVARAECVRA